MILHVVKKIVAYSVKIVAYSFNSLRDIHGADQGRGILP